MHEFVGLSRLPGFTECNVYRGIFWFGGFLSTEFYMVFFGLAVSILWDSTRHALILPKSLQLILQTHTGQAPIYE